MELIEPGPGAFNWCTRMYVGWSVAGPATLGLVMLPIEKVMRTMVDMVVFAVAITVGRDSRV